jgi:RHS repeat-associated protein
MRRCLISALAAILLPACGFAQTGLPPFGSFDRSGLEVRNNQDLNVFFAIPIMSSPGRGINLDFSIYYNSLIWTSGYGTWYNSSSVPWGWATSYSTGSTTNTHNTTQSVCNHHLGDVQYIYTTTYQKYSYTDPLGTVHPFNLYWREVYNECTGSDTTTGTFTSYATDGSGYYASITVQNPDTPGVIELGGTLVGNFGLIDVNGNQISPSNPVGGETDWTDSAGRVALKIIVGSTSIQYKVLDPTGSYQTTTLNLQTLNVKTNFACSGITEYTGTASVPQSLVFPNGQQYQFAYESYVQNSTTYYTGRLNRVTVPTGGYYEYDYTGNNGGINCADGTTLSMNRVVSDGTNTATWTYLRNPSTLTTTITTPQLVDTPNANDTVVVFNSSGQETSRKIYANSPGTGTPLRTINTTWASNGTPATKVTALEDGSTQSEVDTSYDSNGLLDAVSEYNWGSGSRGSLFRTTTFTYQTSTNYTSRNIFNLVISKTIQDGGGAVQYRQDTTYDATSGDNQNCPTGVPQHVDNGYGCSFYYRGNPTSVTTYLAPVTLGNPITKNFTYDVFGNLLSAQLNCCQNKTWSFSSATQYSQPDSVTSGTSPTQLQTLATYNAYTGQMVTFTDENNQITTTNYDVYRRPTSVSQTIGSTNGESITFAYDDVHFSSTMTTSIDSSKSVKQLTFLDGLGRVNLSKTEDAGNNLYSKVSGQYDLVGRPYQTSNAYTTSASYWTTSAFDILGRPTSVTLPDNSISTISYSLNAMTGTDPTGKMHKSTVDSVGRLATTLEPDPTNNNSLTLQTSNTYNVLDQLTLITQGSQTRAYGYDGRGRLTSTTTPEAGIVCFGSVTGTTCNADGYDTYDNLVKRTDARGVLTSYGYDTLNRLTSVSYNVGTTGVPATATVSWSYGSSAANHNNGRLIAMTDGVGSENYTYNNLGQMTQLQKVMNGTTYTTNYAYNVSDELTQISYSSGRPVQFSVDAIGRLCEVAPSTTGCGSASSPFVTGLGYSAASQLTGFKYGNGVYASFGFSADRLQLNCLDYSTTNRNGSCAHDQTTIFGLTYSYGSAGSNNELLSSVSDSVDNGRNATYAYDALSRLTQATTAGSTNFPAWGLSETFDRYGNRLAQTAISGCVAPLTCPQPSVTVSATTNHVSGSPYTYDASGNMTNDGYNTLVYDGENHTVSIGNGSSAGTYVYDGHGHRVMKCVPNCTNPTNTTIYAFSGSKVIAEYDNGAAVGSPSREYIYAGAVLVAKIESSATKYYHQDHISNRLVTDSSGNTVAQMGTFPYGESWYNASNDKLLFTTYERDSESGNDYARARYNVSRLGRFSSPDLVAGNASDPQSLNRYSYVRNMPVKLTDPFGTCPGGTAKNHGADKSQDANGGGPSIYDSDIGGDVTPQGPPFQSGCPGFTSQDNSGSALVLDGQDITDNSGMGIPAFGGGAIGILNWALTPTSFEVGPNPDYWTNSACIYGDCPWVPLTIKVPIYGNIGLFGLASGSPGGAPAGGDPPTDAIAAANAMIKKEDCMKFLYDAVTKAVALENGPSFPGLDAEIKNRLQTMLDSAFYIKNANQTETVGDNQFDIWAKATFPNGQPTVTLYKQFYRLTFTNQMAQILVHEDTHLAGYGVGDISLAKAAIPGYTPDPKDSAATAGGKASEAFQNELKKHCY